MRNGVRKCVSTVIGFALVLSAFSAPAWAGIHVPEMDAGTATSAVALLSGGFLLIAGRARRK